MTRHPWPALRRACCGRQPLLILADYDGTLVPIRPTPQAARLNRGTRHLLGRLARLPEVRLGLVSGRAVRTLQRFVGIPGLIYVGHHGLEIAAPKVRFVHPDARRSVGALRRIARELRAALRAVRGAIVEAKGLSLSIHWRAVNPAHRPRFHRSVQRVLTPWVKRRRIRVTQGKCVLEIRPPIRWGKGEAVRWLIERYDYSRGDILYLGDDRTDEDAFRMVNRYRGVSVLVGARSRRTSARWRLHQPRDVIALLRRLLVTHGRTGR